MMWCGPGASQCTQCSVKPIHLQPRTYSSIEHVTNIKMTGSEAGMWRGHVCIQAQQRRSHRPRYRLLFNADFFGSEWRHNLRNCSVIIILRAKRQVCTQVRRWRRQRSRLAAPAFGFTVFLRARTSNRPTSCSHMLMGIPNGEDPSEALAICRAGRQETACND